MKKFWKKLIGWVVYIAILALLIYGIPRVLAWALDTSYPMASITSSSMWPSLKKGDLVFIKGIQGKQEIQEGDIIVYNNAKGFTIHRVVKLKEDEVITKGDANNTSDAPVAYKEIVGKAVSINDKPLRIPFLGNISLLISKVKI